MLFFHNQPILNPAEADVNVISLTGTGKTELKQFSLTKVEDRLMEETLPSFETRC